MPQFIFRMDRGCDLAHIGGRIEIAPCRSAGIGVGKRAMEDLKLIKPFLGNSDGVEVTICDSWRFVDVSTPERKKGGGSGRWPERAAGEERRGKIRLAKTRSEWRGLSWHHQYHVWICQEGQGMCQATWPKMFRPE